MSCQRDADNQRQTVDDILVYIILISLIALCLYLD